MPNTRGSQQTNPGVIFSLDSEEEFDPSELKLLPVLASGRASTQIAQQ